MGNIIEIVCRMSHPSCTLLPLPNPHYPRWQIQRSKERVQHERLQRKLDEARRREAALAEERHVNEDQHAQP